jgi:hypothetical protein
VRRTNTCPGMPPGGGKMIPDKGNLNEITPLKLLLAMDEQNQTGILSFRKNETLKVFYLNQGKISWAISSDEEDKIEHVLLAKKLVNPEALAPYLAGNKISESFGKILVENGLITLETLINASREQLKRIATSIMFWNSGSYQLELESPPTRLVSLELEIAPLVANYIQAHMDVNIIWEELGSLSGELQQAFDQEKKLQYTLDAEQQEVFACFHEPQRLETVLLRFPAERKHTILKIMYFFLITGLLIKKEAEKATSLDFNELDKLFGHDQPPSQSAVNVELPAMINEAEIRDIPSLDLPDIPDFPAGVKVPSPELANLIPDPRNEPKDELAEIRPSPKPGKPQIRVQPLLPEKQKSRWLSVSFLSILLAAIAIGLFLWINRTPKNTEPEGVNVRPAAHARQKTPEQQKPAPVAPKTEQPPTTQSAAQTVPKKVEPPVTGTKPETTVPETKAPLASFTNAKQAFTAEDFETAGKLWRQEILADKITHSILLEMDCLKESVQSAYQQITDKEVFFILNRVKDGRTCWLVLCGKFRTQNEATQNLRLIPEYFFRQSEPPRVIELEPYL